MSGERGEGIGYSWEVSELLCQHGESVAGTVRTESLRAFTETEMEQIIQKI